jgi:hypothetical protein
MVNGLPSAGVKYFVGEPSGEALSLRRKGGEIG